MPSSLLCPLNSIISLVSWHELPPLSAYRNTGVSDCAFIFFEADIEADI